MPQSVALYLAIALMVIGALVALPRGALWRAWIDGERTGKDRPPRRAHPMRASRHAPASHAPATLKHPAATHHPPPHPTHAMRERTRHAARHS